MLWKEVFSLKQIIAIGIISLLVIGVVTNFLLNDAIKSGVTDMGTGIDKGDTPPQFKLPNLQDEELQLADFKGKKVILNFWATWCKQCREEMPAFQAFSEGRDDVVVLAVNMTHKDSSQQKIEAFLTENSLTFPVVLDKEGDVSKAYSIINIPSTYFINEDGTIHERIEGEVDESRLIEYIDQM